MIPPKLRQYWGVVPAAGTGRRFDAVQPKQYLSVAGKTLAEHTLSKLLSRSWLSGLMVVVHTDDTYWRKLPIFNDRRVQVITGGVERCHSVLCGLDALSSLAADDDWVLVHDVARPCVRIEDLERLKNRLQDHTVGGLLAHPVRDTIKQTNAHQQVLSTIKREGLWQALTPQMFPFARLRDALQYCIDAGFLPTDEAAAIEYTGQKPLLVEGHSDNIKITYPEDQMWMAFMLQQAENKTL